MTRSGLLVVHKPRGPTSHDVVGQARRLFGTREVGHAGTLDPMASGVLVVLVGEATKLSAHLTLDDKTYVARVAFGRSTDTLDAEGTTVEEDPLPADFPSEERLALALAQERLRTLQVPPAFSAVSVGGVRAHRLARRGRPVELEPRSVRVDAIDLVSRAGAEVVVRLSVSKGYYVRAFARDLGAALGVPSHLAALERVASGPYRLEEAVPWPAREPPRLVPLAAAATRALPSVLLTEAGAAKARVGQRLSAEHFAAPPPSVEGAVEGAVAWLGPDGGLVALGTAEGGGSYRVLRGFRE